MNSGEKHGRCRRTQGMAVASRIKDLSVARKYGTNSHAERRAKIMVAPLGDVNPRLPSTDCGGPPSGSLLLIAPFARLTWLDIAIILLVSLVGDIAVNHLSYALGIRNTKW